MKGRAFIAIVGHGPDLEREDGAASVLRALGAEVATLDLWDEPLPSSRPSTRPRARRTPWRAPSSSKRFDRPDSRRRLPARPAPRAAAGGRRGADRAVRATQAARLDSVQRLRRLRSSCPTVPAELYARVRLIEWRRSEFANEERMKVGSIVIDRSRARGPEGRAPRCSSPPRSSRCSPTLCERTRQGGVARGAAPARVGQPLRRRREDGGHPRAPPCARSSARPCQLTTLRGSGYKLDAVPSPAPRAPPPRRSRKPKAARAR